MKKILLTGGTGFIGSNILDEIVKYFAVTILIRKKILKKRKNINYLYFDSPNNLSNLLKKKSLIQLFIVPPTIKKNMMKVILKK